MPFQEIPHIADLSMRVWAADTPSLFVESAKGMNALAGIRLAKKPRVKRTFSTSTLDMESLLVSFLSELVYFAEQEYLAFDRIDLQINHEENQRFQISANLEGTPIESLNKTIKAVTFHNLQIQQTELGFEVEVVFDV
jgi:SHS2 domain-containing protein